MNETSGVVQVLRNASYVSPCDSQFNVNMCGTCKLKTLLSTKTRKTRPVKKSVVLRRKHIQVYAPGPVVDFTKVPRPRNVIIVD